MWNLFFFHKKKNSIFKSKKKRLIKIQRLFSYYSMKTRYYTKDRYLNIRPTKGKYIKLKTYLYRQPFSVDKFFFSKLFSSRLLKRLAAIW